MKRLSLYELNHLVRLAAENMLPDDYWIVAELSSVSLRANGHCYVEFVEKAPRSNSLVAKAHGCIWRDSYHVLVPYFEQTTGQRFAAGLKVLVQVRISFHELYGYSLVVTDIDPTYTLGDVAERRRKIIQQLKADGVVELNKSLPLPRPLARIAVISSSTAAGYGDFTKQLEQSGYPFTTQLFPATMQGDRVEASVIAALDAIAEEQERWDAVVIIRGGGAVSDLNGFDTYELAANVAQFPLPVLTGIGHERDDTVIDLVANCRFKTPTAVAAFLIEKRREEVELLATLAHRLSDVAKTVPTEERHRLDRLTSQLHLAAIQVGTAGRERLLRTAVRLETASQRRLQLADQRLILIPDRLARALTETFTRQHHRLELAERTVKANGPEHILRMGYSITSCNGRLVRQPDDVPVGATLTTHLATGKIESTRTK